MASAKGVLLRYYKVACDINIYSSTGFAAYMHGTTIHGGGILEAPAIKFHYRIPDTLITIRGYDDKVKQALKDYEEARVATAEPPP